MDDKKPLKKIEENNSAELSAIVLQLSENTIPKGLETEVNDKNIPWHQLYTLKGILHSMELHFFNSPFSQGEFVNRTPGRPLFTGKIAASYFALSESDKKKLNKSILDLFNDKEMATFYIKAMLEQGDSFLTPTEVTSTVIGPFQPHYRPEFEIEPETRILHSALNYQFLRFGRYWNQWTPNTHYDYIYQIDLKNSGISKEEANKLLEIFPEEFEKVLRTGFPFMATGISHLKAGINRLAGICINGEVDTSYKGELKPDDCVRGGAGLHGPFYVIYCGVYKGKDQAKYDTPKTIDNIAFFLVPNKLERTAFFYQLAGAYVSNLLDRHRLDESAQKTLTFREFLINNDQCKELVSK